MDVTPFRKEELETLIVQAVTAMEPPARALWSLIAIRPERWQLHPWGDETGGFWVVGKIGEHVIWYNEIEEGFNISRYKTRGEIAEYFCSQNELQHSMNQLLEQIEARGRDLQDSATIPEIRTAVILIAHGSRRATANDDVRAVARDLATQGAYTFVEVAYLELAAPSIPEAARGCVQRGAQRVLLMPYFLSAGRHVVEDLQAFRDDLAQTFPDVSFVLCPPLGLHPLMVQIVRDRLTQGIEPSEVA